MLADLLHPDTVEQVAEACPLTVKMPLEGPGIDVESSADFVSDDDGQGLAPIEIGDLVCRRRLCGGDGNNCDH